MAHAYMHGGIHALIRVRLLPHDMALHLAAVAAVTAGSSRAWGRPPRLSLSLMLCAPRCAVLHPSLLPPSLQS